MNEDNRNAVGVTFVVATWNSDEFLRETFGSLLKVESKHEVLVIDGGSTDDTCKIIEEYRHLLPLRFVKQQSKGLYEGLNEAVRLGLYSHIMFVHSDDRLAHWQADEMCLDEKSVYVGSVTFVKDNEQVYSRYSPIFPRCALKQYPFVFHPNAVYPRGMLLRFPYNEDKYGREADKYQIYEMRNEVKFRRTRAIEYEFRIHSESTTVKGVSQSREGVLFWFWRIYLFLFFENSRLARIWSALGGKRAWS